MSHRIPTARKPRKGAFYSREEITVLSKYKEEYKDQTTRSLRANVLRTKILVDIFNYWDVKETLPLEEAQCGERVKEVAAWVRNNWRPNATVSQSNPTMKIRAIDFMWETRKDAVEEELKLLLGVEELDHRDPRCFQQRNAAAKLALERLSVEEKAEIDVALERRRAEGNPEKIQRFRAERQERKAVQKFAQERWLDMGMLTITFSVHVDEQGRFIGDVHEDVLHNLRVSGRNFIEQHEALVTEMTRKFLDYAKSARLEAAETGNTDRMQADSDRIEIRITTVGFPIIPKAVMDRELKKAEWEKLLRAFLTQHYYLASGLKSKQVPYSALKADTAMFIGEEYRPSNLIFQDPRNMHLDDIRKALQHCYELQAASGPDSAFRFSLFIGPRKRNLFANYLDTLFEPQPNHRKKKDKGKQRADPLQGLLQIEQEPIEGEPPTITNHIEVQPIATPGEAGPSGSRSWSHPASPYDNDLVRINMGQMLRLREMGYEVLGPVNGPNEGYPEYEVAKRILGKLKEKEQLDIEPRPNAPELIDRADPAHGVDPALLGPDANQICNATNSSHNASVMPDGPRMPLDVHPNHRVNHRSSSNVNQPVDDHPTSPPNIDQGLAQDTEGIHVCPTTPPNVGSASPKKTPKK